MSHSCYKYICRESDFVGGIKQAIVLPLGQRKTFKYLESYSLLRTNIIADHRGEYILFTQFSLCLRHQRACRMFVQASYSVLLDPNVASDDMSDQAVFLK